MTAPAKIPMSHQPEALEPVPNTKLLRKRCRLCGKSIVESRHRRDATINHLDTAHPGWRAR